MLHQYDVAGHQVGRYEASELVVRKVPWLDAKQDSDRTALDGRLTCVALDGLRRKEPRSMFRVVVDDVGTQRDLAPALSDQFSISSVMSAANSSVRDRRIAAARFNTAARSAKGLFLPAR